MPMPRLSAPLLAFAMAPLSAVVAADPPAYEPIEPGLDYARIARSEGPMSIHVLRIERGKADWIWASALGDDRVYGLAPLTRIVRSASAREGARPLAAINGDFFAIAPGNYQGDPVGLQVIRGEPVSDPGGEPCAWVDAEGSLHLDVIESRFRATWPGSNGEVAMGLDEPRGDDGAVLYTPSLAYPPGDARPRDFTTRTTGGRELILEPEGGSEWLPLQIGRSYRAKVAAVREAGNAPLGPKSVILSIGPKLAGGGPAPEPGDAVSLALETTPDLSGAQAAIAGGPLLVRDGEDVAPKGDAPGARARHPRSLIGWNATHAFLAVVDGRQPKLSVGMTFAELAALARELGCTEAMNLDGGGSSTLWADGRVLNSPSDGDQRAIANALILLERPSPSPATTAAPAPSP